MEVKRIEQNELWPLPADYYELGVAGQRRARINGVRQWLLPWGDRKQKGIVFARCMSFFEKQYLWDRSRSKFFDVDPIPSAPFHLYLAAKSVEHFRTIAIQPRGSGKTTKNLVELLMKAACMPRYTAAYSTSTHDLSVACGARVREEFMTNELLLADFSSEFPGGRLEPKRGRGTFSDSLITLTNGTTLKFWSAGGRQRGGRMMEYWLDDVEYDAKGSTDVDLLRSDMERLVFNIIMPMVLRAGSQLHIRGTFVSPKSYLYHLMAVEDDGKGELVPLEPRMEYFERFVVKLVDDREGRLVSAWPHMWPVDAAQRDELGLDPDTITCEQMEGMLGPAVFRAEMQADPAALTDSYFELKGERDEWWFEDLDEKFATEPLNSNTLICWNRGPFVQKEPIGQLLKRSFVFVMLDTSFTATATSDYKVAQVLLYTDDNELISLDMWDGKTEQMELSLAAFKLGHKWGARMLCPQKVSSESQFIRELETLAREKMIKRYGVENTPTIRPVQIKNESKVSRIMSLRIFFEHGLVKLPRFARTGPYLRLREQIATFNPGVKDGGLRNDDHIDTLGTALLVNKAAAHAIEAVQEPATVLERALDGETQVEGIPILAFLPEITMKDLLEVQNARRERRSVV